MFSSDLLDLDPSTPDNFFDDSYEKNYDKNCANDDKIYIADKEKIMTKEAIDLIKLDRILITKV